MLPRLAAVPQLEPVVIDYLDALKNNTSKAILPPIMLHA